MTASVSTDGMTWTDVGTQRRADVRRRVRGTRSHQPLSARLTTATFENVAVTVPAATATTPPSGPVAAWSFDDGVGSVARASIGGLDGVDQRRHVDAGRQERLAP